MKKKFIKMFALATILCCGLGAVTSCTNGKNDTPPSGEVDDVNLTLSDMVQDILHTDNSEFAKYKEKIKENIF